MKELGSNKYLNAIGALVLQWNQAEASLDEIIWLYLNVNSTTGRVVKRPLANQSKTELLSNLINMKEPDVSIREHIIHVMECWKICASNRNTIVHGSPFSTSEEFDLLLKKHNKKTPRIDVFYEFAYDDIVSIYGGVTACSAHLLALKAALSPLLQYREMAQEAELNEAAPPNAPEIKLPDRLR